jgi:hypothetical protein
VAADYAPILQFFDVPPGEDKPAPSDLVPMSIPVSFFLDIALIGNVVDRGSPCRSICRLALLRWSRLRRMEDRLPTPHSRVQPM